MNPRHSILALAACLLLAPAFPAAAQEGDAKRGEYLMKAGGCLACHTEEKDGATPFAGGRGLKTPFGTFYGPNITPDAKAGIGNWSEADFVRAMRTGISPSGGAYYPAFPYPSYTKMSDADLKDLWAYLRSLPPSSTASKPHDLGFPFNMRLGNRVWQLLFFKPGPMAPDPKQTAQVNRGAYVVQALSHCGECHTPRNFMGGPKTDRFLAGGKGPEGKGIPNITPTRLKSWSDKDLKDFLTSGITSDGDVTGDAMGEVIKNTITQLTPEDLDAMVAYLRTVPALPDEDGGKK